MAWDFAGSFSRGLEQGQGLAESAARRRRQSEEDELKAKAEAREEKLFPLREDLLKAQAENYREKPSGAGRGPNVEALKELRINILSGPNKGSPQALEALRQIDAALARAGNVELPDVPAAAAEPSAGPGFWGNYLSNVLGAGLRYSPLGGYGGLPESSMGLFGGDRGNGFSDRMRPLKAAGPSSGAKRSASGDWRKYAP